MQRILNQNLSGKKLFWPRKSEMPAAAVLTF